MTGLPPGPSNAALTTFRYMRDPVGSYTWFRQKYGDTVAVPTLGGPLVITGEPEGAREVFTADPAIFDVLAPENVGMVFPALSVAMLSGDAHQRERKLLLPPFHSSRMSAYARTMQEVALRRTGDWRPGSTFAMQDVAKAISYEVILRNVFGMVEAAGIKQLEEAFIANNLALTPSILFFKGMRRRFGGFGPYAGYLRAKARVDALIAEQIARRRANPDSSQDDILGLLLSARYSDGSAMSDQAIRDELIALLVAGHNAAAIALAWAFYWLHRYPDVLRKLREELAGLPTGAGPEALIALPYLEAVCNETLRIYPPVPDVFRLLRAPLQLRGYTLPPGTGVAVFTTMVHWREELYPEPKRFRPERFLERRFSPFEFMPYGGGARRCLGAAFAQQEIKVVLGTLIRSFELALVDPEEQAVRQGVGVGPKRGVRMRMVRRLDA